MAINFDHTNNTIITEEGALTTNKGKNIIINGNMGIWQRGTSFAAAGSGTFSADRWSYHKGGAVVHTTKQNTATPTFAQSGVSSNYSLQADVTTADASIATGDFSIFQYNIEGYDIQSIYGGDATLSFWVYSSRTGIHCVSFRNSTADRSYVVEYTVDSAGTWQKVEITVPLTETGGTWDFTNGLGLSVAWTMAAGSTLQTTADAWQTGNYLATSNQVNVTAADTDTFLLSQVQFERGAVATPFELRHFAEEIQICYRYFQINGYLYGHAYSTTEQLFIWSGIVPMRSNPSVTLTTTTPYTEHAPYTTSASGSSSTVVASHNTHEEGFDLRIGGFTGLTAGNPSTMTPNQLHFDAEI